MKKRSVFSIVLVSVLLLVLAVSCGEDPFFHTVTVISQDSVIAEEIVPDGDTFTLPRTPEGKGTFSGWLVDGVLMQSGETFKVTKSLVIKASWAEKEEYTITYKADGKEVTKTYTVGEIAVFTTPDGIVKDGFVVDGWYTDSSCVGTFYKTGSTITLTGDTTLYAHWVDRNIEAEVDESTGEVSVRVKESEKASVTTVTIPDTYDGKAVTAVSKDGFKDCTALTGVTLGSVKTIGDGAFEGCTKLASLTIPSSVTAIGEKAFASSGLKEISFSSSSSLETIGKEAFKETALTSLTIPSSVKTIDEGAFSSITTLSSLTLSTDGVLETIGKEAFKGTALTSLTIPSSVKTIDEGAFSSITTLTSLTLSSDGVLEKIGKEAFKGTSLTSLTIPSSVKTIDEGAFSALSTLKTLTLSSDSVLETIGKESFKGTSLTSLTIPSSVKTIDEGAFSSSSISSISFAEEGSLENIGSEAFSSCTALKSITIPLSVKTIGDNAFASSGLTSLTVDNSENSIPGYEKKWGSSVSSITWLRLKITYYPNGGSGEAVEQTFLSGSVTLKSGSDFSREEYVFGGWNTSADGKGKAYEAGSTVKLTSNQNLYAVWNEKYPLLTFTLDETSGTYSVKARNSSISGEITIPSTYYGKKVTLVEDNAFASCTKVTKITLGDNVTSVGASAFSGCTALTSADLKSATTVGSSAFSGCTSLTTVDTKKVTSLGDSVFSGCTKLASADLTSVTTLGGGVFYGCTSLTSVTLPSGMTEIKAATSGSETKGFFENCSALKSITLPTSLTTIGENTFKGTGLTSFTVPDTVTTIGKNAFASAVSLETLTFGTKLTTLGDGAFSSCTSLKSVTVPSGIKTLGSGIFSGCTGMTSLTINEGVTTLTDTMFSGCTGLETVTIPSSVTTIDDTTFKDCTGIKTIRVLGNGDTFINVPSGNWGASNATVIKVKAWTITYKANGGEGSESQTYLTAESVTLSKGSGFSMIEADLQSWNTKAEGTGTTYKLGETITPEGNVTLYAIWKEHYPDLTFTLNGDTYSVKAKNNKISGEITIPALYNGKKVTIVADNAFESCTGITKITLGDNVTSVGASAFSGCTALTSADLKNATTVGSSAFSGCTSLTTVTMSKVTSLGDSVFSGCTKLASADLTSVTTLGGGVFYGCTSLTSVTLPEGMTEIKAATSGSETKGFFENCSALKSVALPATLTTIGENTFKGAGLTSFTVPDTVTTIGKNAFASCTSLKSATVSGKVESIGEGVFLSCTALDSVTIKEGVTALSANMFFGCSALKEITIPSTVENPADIDATAFSSTGLVKITLKHIDDGSFTVPEGNWGAAGATIVWTDPYIITYNINGGDSGEIEALKVAPGKSKTLSDGAAFTRIEADLVSWNTAADGTGTTYKLGETITPEGNVTLYAIWKEHYPDLTFTLNGDTYSVKAKNNKISGEITIPALYNGKKVTLVEDNAFASCTKVTKITLGDNVTSVGASAFSGCTALTSAVLKNATTVGSSAFSGCTSLTTVTMSKVTSLGDSVFSGCTKLASADLTSVTVLGGGVFYGCTSLTSVTLPEGMTEIKAATSGSETKGFFENCSALKSITLPTSLTTIGENTFKGAGLTSFIVPDTVTTIGKNAFASAVSLETLTFGTKLTTLGDGAFSSCTSLKSVTVPSGIKTLGSGIFSLCTGLTSLTIDEGVTTLTDTMFSGCTGLETVTIPSSVTTIDDTTFKDCTGIAVIKLQSADNTNYITVPEGQWGAVNAKITQVKTCTITYDANGGEGTDIQHYTTGESVTLHLGDKLSKIEATIKEWNTASDGNGTTYECGKTYDNIEGDITLYAIWNENYPDLVFTLDSSSDTYSVKAKSTSISGSIVIPETYGGKKVTAVADEGFKGCESITAVELPSSITTIGSSAFYDCYKLAQINIPEGIKEIKDSTFRYCYKLTSIDLPDSVETIGQAAFHSSGLTSFVISGSVKSIGWYALSCSKLNPTISKEASLNIASGALSIDAKALNSETESITIENYANAISVPSGNWGASKATITWSYKKLTYDLGGGTAEGGSTTLADAFKRGEEITLPSNVTKDGYVLDGWYTKTDARGVFEEGGTKRTMSEREDMTLYAHWVDDALEFTPVTEGGVTTYTVSSVKSDKKDKTTYTVPSVYHGCKVTAVAASCFASCTSATKIIIPETVTTIGDDAFSGCTALTDVEIDALKDDITGSPWGAGSEDKIKWQKTTADITITYDGNGNDPSKGTIDPVTVGFRVETTLSDGSGFKRIESNIMSWNTESDGTGESYELGGTYKFSKSVTLYAIWKDNYPGLKFTHKENVEYYDFSSAEGAVVTSASGWVVTAEDSSLTMTRIPDEYGWDGAKEKVIGIGDNAFSSCENLTKVEIQCTKLIYIGKRAFEGVPITEINLPDGLSKIYKAAFKGTKLTSVTIPDTVFVEESDDSEEVFMNCTDLKTVKLGSRMRYLMNYYFSGCTSLESITIPDNVGYIQNEVFAYCSSLTSVTFGNGLTEHGLGIGVFAYCTSLKSIVMPEGLKYLGGEGYTFQGCTSLTDVTLPSTLEKLYGADFAGCTSLKSIKLPDSLVEIGFNAFYGSGLESITIPSSVTTINNDIFMNCTSLKTVTLSDNCKIIGNYMFYNCSSLESITIPSCVTSIGEQAFYGTALKSITIPESVTNIDEEAFASCSNLEAITLNTYKNRISDSPWGASNATVTWTKLKLSFDYNEGWYSGWPEIKALAFLKGDAVSLLSSSVLKKSGYNLDGWYKADGTYLETDADGKHVMTEDEDVSVTANWVEDSLTFTALTDESGAVTGYSVSASDKTKSSYTIPSVYKGKPVTEIANGGFSGCTSATSITVPESVTTIASDAFTDYTGTINLSVENNGKLTGSPWGATSATINWKTTGN